MTDHSPKESLEETRRRILGETTVGIPERSAGEICNVALEGIPDSSCKKSPKEQRNFRINSWINP